MDNFYYHQNVQNSAGMFQYGQYAPQFSQRLKDCPMEAAADFPMAHVLAILQKESPCATVTRFSTGIVFSNSCLVFCTSYTNFSKFKPLM